MEPLTLATAVTSLISPFLPNLVELAKEAGSKFAAKVGEKAGELSLEKAKQVWAKITQHDNGDVEDAARLAMRKPDDEKRLELLIRTLADEIQGNQKLAEELHEILGGDKRIQEIIATGESKILNVVQSMSGAGTQTMRAELKSEIQNARQIQK